MIKKFFIAIGLMAVGVCLLYIFRTPLLKSCSASLIKEGALQKSEALFILSGGGLDRGNEAALLFQRGLAHQLICTGGNLFAELQVFGIDTLESEMTAANLRGKGVPDSCIVVIGEGTSTKEEADIVLKYCLQKKWKQVIVLTSKLHTRRVQKVFKKKFEQAGIELIIHGAPSSRFDEYNWWKDENGLIAVNNEWLKNIYYWLKH